MKLALRIFLGVTMYGLWTVSLLSLILEFYWIAGGAFMLSLIVFKIDNLIQKKMKGFDPLP